MTRSIPALRRAADEIRTAIAQIEHQRQTLLGFASATKAEVLRLGGEVDQWFDAAASDLASECIGTRALSAQLAAIEAEIETTERAADRAWHMGRQAAE